MSRDSKDSEMMGRRRLSEPVTAPSSRPGRAHSIGGYADGNDGTIHADHSSEHGTSEGSEETGDNTENATGGQRSCTSKVIFPQEKQQKSDINIRIFEHYSPSDESSCQVIINTFDHDKSILNVNVLLNLSVPEWFHIKRSDEKIQCLNDSLKQVGIKISYPYKIMTVELETIMTNAAGVTSDDIMSVQKAFTEMKKKIAMQCFHVPDCFHKAALEKLQQSDFYHSFKGTFWKSKDVLVFVADVDSRDIVFGDFYTILCSVSSEKSRVDKATSADDCTAVHMSSGTMKGMETEYKQAKYSLSQDVYQKFGQKMQVHFQYKISLSTPLNHFLSNSPVAQQYVIDELSKHGITCAFDDINGSLEVSTEEKIPVSEMQNILHHVVREEHINFDGKNVLCVFNLDEIERNIQHQLEGFRNKLIVLPEKPKQELTLVGTDDALTSAKELIAQLFADFADVEEINVPAEDYQNLVEMKWLEIETVSKHLKSGIVKCFKIPHRGIKVCGKKVTIEEFKQKVSFKKTGFTSPIMEPQLSLLIAKSAVESFVAEEAAKRGITVEIDTKKKRYVVASGPQDSKEFLTKWHETLTFPLGHYSGEWSEESLRSYLNQCDSLDDSKVLVKLEGSVLNIIATADVIPCVEQCLEDFKKQKDMHQQKQSGKKCQQAAGTGHHLNQQRNNNESTSPPLAPEGSSLTRSTSNVESFSESTESKLIQVDKSEETDEIVEQNGKITLKCTLPWPLPKYCKEIINCKDHVVEEFKKKEFDVQIDRECKTAKVELSSRDDVMRVKDLFASFGARVISSFKEKQYHLTAFDAKDLLEKQNSDSKNLVIHVDSGGRLVLFGKKKLLDDLHYTLRGILDDYSDDIFYLTLTEEEQEDVKRGILQEMEQDFACGKVAISQKNEKLEVSGPRHFLQKCRFALYKRLESISGNRQVAHNVKIKHCYITVSDLFVLFLKEKDIMDDVWKKFRDAGFSVSLEKTQKVAFGAISFSALDKAECLLKNLITEKKYALRQEAMLQLWPGEKVSTTLINNLQGQAKILAVVDEYCDLRIVCWANDYETVDKELRHLQDQFTRDTIDISKRKLGEKRNSDDLTRELFEIDRQLMGNAKVVVDDNDLTIVATKDLQQQAEKKLLQLLSKIESESEINKKNPNICVQLNELQLRLLEQPEVLDYIYEKVQNNHLQMTFNVWENCIRVYGLSETFAKAGKDLVESCFRERKFSFLKDLFSEVYNLEDIKEMIAVQHPVHLGKIVTAVDDQHQTLTLVCTDDVFQNVLDKVDHIRRSYPGSKVLCRIEEMMYVKKFKSEELHAVERNDVLIETVVDGGSGTFEIKGPSGEVQNARRKIEELCAGVTLKTFDFDNEHNFQVLKRPEGVHAVQVTGQTKKSVVILREPLSSRPERECISGETEHVYAFSEESKSSPLTIMHETELLKVKTGVIAVISAEKKIPTDIYKDLEHAGVIDEWAKFSGRFTKQDGKQSVKGRSVRESVQFGDKKLFRCEYIAFCQMPQWEKKGAIDEKERTKETIQYLLQECSKRSVSQVLAVIAIGKSQLFKRIAKQVILQVRESQEDFSSPRVVLLSAEECIKDLQNVLHEIESDTSSGGIFKNMLRGTKKESISKGAAKVNEKKQIVLEIGALEKQKVDVIVNSVNQELDMTRGATAKILNRETNGKLQEECRRKYLNKMKVGEVVSTGSHGLPCKAVYHGVLPSYTRTEELEFLRIFIHRCLKKASNAFYESIAFPVLGTGNLGYPVEEVASTMFCTVDEYLKQYPQSSLKKVVFVLYEKDMNVIQVFKAEWMTRAYQRNRSKASTKEERFHSGNVMIQLLQSDVLNSAGADQIMCFWSEDQLSDFSCHPILGKYAAHLQWKVYGPELREKKVKAMPSQTVFPTQQIVNVVIDSHQANHEDLLLKAILMASNSGCYVLQFPFLTQGDQPFVQVVGNSLRKCLSEQLNGVLCLINIVANATNYATLERMFQEQFDKVKIPDPSEKTSWWNIYDFASGWVKDTFQTAFRTSSNERETDRDRPVLVIAAESESVCRDTFTFLMKQLQQIDQNHSNISQGSDHGSMDDFVHIETPEEDRRSQYNNHKPFTASETEINPYYLKSPNWKSVKDQLKDKFAVDIKVEGQKHYIVGQFEDIVGAHAHLSGLKGFSATGPQTIKESKGTIRQQTQTVSLDQLNAVKHLIGPEEFQKYCDIEDIKQDQMKIYFLNNGNESSSVQQRIQGVIQEEMVISVGDRDRAKDVASQAMKGHTDVYIKYQEDRNIMLMFAEDWNKMARAKKRVSMHFGQAKVSSRGGRRFAGSKTAEADSSVKVSFDKNSGCARGRHIIVRVYKADITNVQTEVIVNAANGYLSHGAGVARAIADAAGPTMTREGNEFYQKNGAIKVSHLAITSAGRLPYKMVFHAVGPEWYNYSDKKQCLEDLCNTILRCLCEAEKQDVESIAIPSISAAIFRVPKEDCARMYVRALKSFDGVDGIGSLKEVHFVDVSDKMVSVIEEVLKVSWDKPTDEDQQKKDNDFIKQCLKSNVPSSVDHASALQPHMGKEDHETKTPDFLPDGFFKFSDGISVNIFKNDIFKIKTSAIISWENEGLYGRRPFIDALIEEAGDLYKYERKKYAYAKSGDIIPTLGGKLHQDKIFHVVLGKTANTEDFTTSLKSVFGMCIKNKCTTVTLPVYLNICSPDMGINKRALFIETVVDVLLALARHKTKPSLHVHILNDQQNLVDELEVLLRQYLISLGMKQRVQSGQEEDTMKPQVDSQNNNCAICLEPLSNPSELKCGHTFCRGCIKKAFKVKKVCPECKTVCGIVTGDMPHGSMSSTTRSFSLPGYHGCNTIIISYYFAGGTQEDGHPNPGLRYLGTSRTAYLPDTPEGRKVLALLEVAWKRKLTFTIGPSVTREDGVDRVTWNEIHHKTNIDGGPTNYGYPDPDYLKRVQEELAAQGVTEKDLGTDV